jgi:rRNA maturation endonuclease Nob1
MVRYVCIGCGFESNEEIETCPYCGEEIREFNEGNETKEAYQENHI